MRSINNQLSALKGLKGSKKNRHGLFTADSKMSKQDAIASLKRGLGSSHKTSKTSKASKLMSLKKMKRGRNSRLPLPKKRQQESQAVFDENSQPVLLNAESQHTPHSDFTQSISQSTLKPADSILFGCSSQEASL